jgi:Uma2 family endonuclease
MALQPQAWLSSAEYLAIERQATCRSEYVAGEMFAMAGASRRHNLIVANVIRILGNQLLASPCNVYPSDMRLKIPRTGRYTYPDVVVACAEEQFEDEHRDTLLNPVVIIEVLSDSTEAYDRGKKFEEYQRIESLVEYILIAQDHYSVECYVRQDQRTWLYSVFRSLEDIVLLSPIGCQLVLQDVYTKVDLQLSTPTTTERES